MSAEAAKKLDSLEEPQSADNPCVALQCVEPRKVEIQKVDMDIEESQRQIRAAFGFSAVQGNQNKVAGMAQMELNYNSRYLDPDSSVQIFGAFYGSLHDDYPGVAEFKRAMTDPQSLSAGDIALLNCIVCDETKALINRCIEEAAKTRKKDL